MPRADKMKPWSNQEIIKALKYIDDHINDWKDNRLTACDRAIKDAKIIDRDPKSVYNKVHNMIKNMDDKTKRKTSVSFQSRKIMALLKSIRTKSGETTDESKINSEVVPQMSSLNITEPTGAEMADSFTETVKAKNQQLKELTDDINLGLSELKDMEGKISKHRSDLKDLEQKVSQYRSKLQAMEEEVTQQRSDIKEMEDEKKVLEKFFYELSTKK